MRTLRRVIHLPSAAKLWHSPAALKLPSWPRAPLRVMPEEVQATSYLAASASISSFSGRSMRTSVRRYSSIIAKQMFVIKSPFQVSVYWGSVYWITEVRRNAMVRKASSAKRASVVEYEFAGISVVVTYKAMKHVRLRVSDANGQVSISAPLSRLYAARRRGLKNSNVNLRRVHRLRQTRRQRKSRRLGSWW